MAERFTACAQEQPRHETRRFFAGTVSIGNATGFYPVA
jgi:hypothetical protein